ncbi:MAG: hypothetical protein ACLSAO_03960 [Anaerovoracaceae bacterium]
MNLKKLKHHMKIHDIKPSEMARAANISLYEWNRKMKEDGDSFNIKEMDAMINKGKMNKIEAAEIFFDEKLQKRK